MKNFACEFDAALAALESVTAHLGRSDPSELDRISKLLAGRQKAMSEVTRRLSEQVPTAELAARLRRVFEQGGELEERLMVTRAATRQQMAELHRAGFHARAMAWQGPYDSSLDIEA